MIMGIIKRNKIRTIALVLLIIVLGFWYKNKNSDTGETVTQTAEVARGTIVSAVTASGTVISSNIENVTTQASGTVKKVYVSDGESVNEGQKLAEIELDVQGQQNYLSSYSSYVSAQNSLNSANNSYRSTQASLQVVYDDIQGHDNDESFEMKERRTKAEVANDNAYDSLRAAQLRLSVAAADLKTNSPIITAPTSGVIKSVTIAEGMNIGASETSSGSRANQRIATIGTEGLPIASFDVSEIDVTQIQPGQKAVITLDSITDATFTGKVVSVDRVGSTTNNVTTYPVIIQFDTNSDQILPNMATTANIIVDKKTDVLSVPSAAINYSGDTTTVTLIKNGEEITQTVETGIESDTKVEIVSGVSEGDEVVIGTVSASANQTSQRSTSLIGTPGGGGGMMLH